MVTFPVCGLLPSSPVTMSTASSPVMVAFCTSMMVGSRLFGINGAEDGFLVSLAEGGAVS